MSLDDLLPLLFVAVFVVNAVMRGRRARRGRSTRNRPNPNRPATPAPTAETREAPRPERPSPSPAAAGDEAGGSSPADDLRRRIEEAQRRVREAMAEDGSDAERAPRADTSRPEPSRPEPPTGPPDTGRPAAGPPSARPPAPASVPSLGREGLPPGRTAAPPGPGSLGREGTPPRRPERVPAGDDEAPRITRLGEGSSSARLRAARGLGKDRDDIVRGFVWAMVLERPVALRMRRSSSPRRSR